MPIVDPERVEPRKGSSYPTEEFRRVAAGRLKRALGDAVGLTDFGVNHVTLEPGAASALRHWHTREDEFVFVISGEVILVSDEGEQVLGAGMAAGFPANDGNGHHLVNRSDTMATFLEVGTRTPEDDEVHYPDVDLHIPKGRAFTHKDGTPY